MQIINLPASTSLATTDAFVKETSAGTTQKITAEKLKSSLNAIETLSGITPVTTYVDTTGTLETRAYRQGNIVAFHFTFQAAATSASNTAIFTGLPGAYGSAFQFTAFNVTSQKAITFAVTTGGALSYWYSNNGFVAGDQIRGSVTYICA